MRGDDAQRDEREVGDDEIARAAEVGGVGVADIGLLVDVDSIVGSDLLVELITSDIDGDDTGRPPLQHTVGEPTRRRPDVDDTASGRIDAEVVERRIELLATSAHEPGAVAGDLDRLPRVDQAGRLGGRSTTDGDLAALDEFPGLGSARGEPAPDEFGVKTAPCGHVSPRGAGRPAPQGRGQCARPADRWEGRLRS